MAKSKVRFLEYRLTNKLRRKIINTSHHIDVIHYDITKGVGLPLCDMDKRAIFVADSIFDVNCSKCIELYDKIPKKFKIKNDLKYDFDKEEYICVKCGKSHTWYVGSPGIAVHDDFVWHCPRCGVDNVDYKPCSCGFPYK